MKLIKPNWINKNVGACKLFRCYSSSVVIKGAKTKSFNFSSCVWGEKIGKKKSLCIKHRDLFKITNLPC